MEEIIKKAIDSGYNGKISSNENYSQWCRRCVMDTPFWQALGKACGFCIHEEIDSGVCAACGYEDEEDIKLEWQVIALRFHEINLTENWNAAISYLQEITK